ncbi:aminotransferase [Prauserella marina]|uniref:Branched-chain amino acid aminotransferase/4-amino-4-deoxychorismate lyase n=1 Tax=Prauserella marina TaxID=530584 RepID=A0A222VIB4_9PSEU|nr:aminotransferase class IV family protein [Prauserella marina]ASR33647.1 aminotransferase [Prauserella marina]PWV82187.1 branched-subunit amino acid aminotransferase/4-amino-4-deoxychorismate lyase [Prauserella marina]SDD21195.1 Branched-chain amino acid aminotransferase/4-amino-4-deoxychorismate lyase [Prauserella marina]
MELNGAPATVEQLSVLALANYGHFTSMLVDEGRARGLHLHLQRLARDCREVFGVDLDTERVRHHIRRALGGRSGSVIVRVTVYDPALDLGSIGADADPHVLVTTRTGPLAPPSPWRLRSTVYGRELPEVKHVGLFGALHRRRAAQREGYDDVLFVNADGIVSELSTSNIGFVRDGGVFWPRSEWLPGVTMALLDGVLGDLATWKPVTLADVPSMDAVFATNAASGIRAIAAVDAHCLPTGHPMLRRLGEMYTAIAPEVV